MWQKYLMWDLPFQRMNDRNMPLPRIVERYRFDGADHRVAPDDRRHASLISRTRTWACSPWLASTTKDFDITSSTLNNAGDELILNIGDGGLAPGEMVRFKIDLEVDAAFAGQIFTHPDYRTVMFDMNGLNVYDGFCGRFQLRRQCDGVVDF